MEFFNYKQIINRKLKRSIHFRNDFRYNCTVSIEKNSILIFPGEGTTHFYDIELPNNDELIMLSTNMIQNAINYEAHGSFNCAGFKEDKAYEDTEILMSQRD